jgi:hypothetical protein
VLSIGKLNQQTGDYYETSVTDSREDYYALSGEGKGTSRRRGPKAPWHYRWALARRASRHDGSAGRHAG